MFEIFFFFFNFAYMTTRNISDAQNYAGFEKKMNKYFVRLINAFKIFFKNDLQ